MGYHFISLRDFGGEVNFQGQYAVRTTSGPIQLSPKDEYWRMQLFNAGGQVVKLDLSPTRMNGSIELSAEVPPWGWATGELMKRHAPGARSCIPGTTGCAFGGIAGTRCLPLPPPWFGISSPGCPANLSRTTVEGAGGTG